MPYYLKFNLEEVKFKRVSERIEKSEKKVTLYSTFSHDNWMQFPIKDKSIRYWGDGREITLLKIKSDNNTKVFAFDDFAGITEEEEEISVHLCSEEEIERVGRSIHISKKDNTIEKGNYYYWSYVSEFTRKMYE